MYYDNKDLQKRFEQIANGRTPEQFIREATKNLLTTWLHNENGKGEYKITGGYWEVLYPILNKYQPNLLEEYESIVGGFSYFDSEVKELFDQGSDLLNLVGTLLYMDERRNNLPEDIHYIDLGNDEIKPYIPNQNIDLNNYWGRENE